jgi:hypothetical protein
MSFSQGIPTRVSRFLLLAVALSFQPSLLSASLQCAPCALGFGTVKVSQSKTMSVSLTNSQSVPITITSILKSAPEFTLSGLPLPFTIGAGKTAAFNIVFAPLDNRAIQGSFRLVNSASTAALLIAVSGTGLTSGTLSANPTSINFGSVPLGTGVTKTQTLTNSGTTNVTVNSVGAGGSFWISGITAPVNLSPGASITFYAHFNPASAGTTTGGLAVQSSASDSRLVVPLTGSTPGAGQLSLSPSAMNFGSVTVGSTRSLSATLSATGAGVTISSDSLSSSEFSLAGLTLPLSLAAGQSKSFTINFKPQASGTATATLSLKTGAAGTGPAVSESLTGAGSAASAHSVALAWKASPSPVMGYNVYRGAQSGGPYARVNSATDAATAYTDSSVQAGQTYFYVVTAVDNSNKESPYSNQAQAVIPTP